MQAAAPFMTLLGIDVGTTRLKVALFERDGTPLSIINRANQPHRDREGHAYYDPEELWRSVTSALREALVAGTRPDVVGVSSMAESGLLLDRDTGSPRTHILPWYDERGTATVDTLRQQDRDGGITRRSGLHPSFKHSLVKLLWLREHQPERLNNAVWLSVADYIVYRLTSQIATDPTLAARTLAYDIYRHHWDEAWIASVGLETGIFPPVLPSGMAIGCSTTDIAAATRLAPDTPVAVSGHDHICTLLAAGMLGPGHALDSVGTAEAIMGVLPPNLPIRSLGTGLAVAPHVLPGCYCWLGGISAAGGSIEWLRSWLGPEPLDYPEVERVAREAPDGPTGILYFPFLAGGHLDPSHRLRAAFIGLSSSQGRPHFARAVLEGTAYAFEDVRRTAERLIETTVNDIVVVGGGARNALWMQIKADVSGCTLQIPRLPEATALGAALTAAMGSGLFTGTAEIEQIAKRARQCGTQVSPNIDHHQAYRSLFESKYLVFDAALRAVAQDAATRSV